LVAKKMWREAVEYVLYHEPPEGRKEGGREGGRGELIKSDWVDDLNWLWGLP